VRGKCRPAGERLRADQPAGEVLARGDFLGAVGSGAIGFLSDEVTSQIRVRRHGNTAVLRY
jgi:hypothetical protein